jgi:hypothetical protein
VIKKESLEIGGWYIGKGRGFHMAVWDGKVFKSHAQKFNYMDQKTCDHWDDGGCFAPMALIPDPRWTKGNIHEKTGIDNAFSFKPDEQLAK